MRKCITHHHACDCREELFSQMAIKIESVERENEKLRNALIEARRWIGDGECSDGLPREYWTKEFSDAVDLVDSVLRG